MGISLVLVLVVVGISLELVTEGSITVKLVGVMQVVVGLIVGFVGTGALRKSVVGRISPGRNNENNDLGISVVLNNSVSA